MQKRLIQISKHDFEWISNAWKIPDELNSKIAEAIIDSEEISDDELGEWVDDGDPCTIICSKCGYRVNRYNDTRFCPYCGNQKNLGDTITVLRC